MQFTVISNASGISKVPVAPNNDNIFNFINVDVPFEKCHELYHKYFVLSRPLNNSLKSKRDSSLEQYYSINDYYIVVDFDKVQDKNAIVQYFKNNNYSINLFESRNNLKGVVLVDFICYRNNVEAFLTMLDTHLEGVCEVDVSSARNASYQAPTLKTGNVFFNVGIKPNIETIKQYIQIVKPTFEYSDIDTDWFWNTFISKYGMDYKDYFNCNGTIQCSLPSEVKTKFSYYWNKNTPWLLMHPNKNKTLNIFSDFIKSPEGRAYFKNKTLINFKNKFNINRKNTVFVDEQYFSITENIMNIVESFNNTPNSVLVIKGIMGSGKSNIIDYIKKPRTLYVSVRKTLSYDIKEKYNCKHYIDNMGHKKDKDSYRPGDSLVVQIDSLHKINTDYFDYVVIDEFESFCLYTTSINENDNYIHNMSTIRKIFEKKLIVLDAFINNYSLDNYFGSKNLFTVVNKYKDKSKVLFYKHKETFISILEETCINRSQNEIITCSFGTLDDMKAVKNILEKHKLKVITIDSSITDEARNLVTKLLKNEDTIIYDVVLFSPTITVGISILNNVKNHFHFDLGKSVDTISSVQMTKRSRKAEYVHVFCAGHKHSKTIDSNILDSELLKTINSLSHVNSYNILYDYSTNEISDIGKFINKFTAHKNFYIGDTPSIIRFLLEQQFSTIQEINELIKHPRFAKEKSTIRNKKQKVQHRNIELEDLFENGNYLKINDPSYYNLLILKENLNLSDTCIVNLYNYYGQKVEKIKVVQYLLFYSKSIHDRKNEIDSLLVKSLKNIINHSQEYFKVLKFLSTIDIQLADVYSKNDVQQNIIKNSDFLQLISILGYKSRKGGYYLPSILKAVIKEVGFK